MTCGQVGRDASGTSSLLLRLRALSDELLPLGHRVAALRRAAEELVGGSPPPDERPESGKKQVEPSTSTSKHTQQAAESTSPSVFISPRRLQTVQYTV